MRISVITPTILRPSLKRCIDSVDSQTHSDWEQIVAVDRHVPYTEPTTPDGRRKYLFCPVEHRNFGNSCRNNAWHFATGDYVIHLDDDNFLSDSRILEDISAYLFNADNPDVAVFPIHRFGQTFFSLPPRSCHADTANIVVKREIGQWPDRPEYTADGFWMENLVTHYGYKGFPEMRPIVVIDTHGKGE